MMHRTRIKICGLTRQEDVCEVVAAGADAVGFVFYPDSPRYVEPKRAAELIAIIPPFVTTVGLFVNASMEQVKQTLSLVPLSLLQFHGDETPAYCAELANMVNRPFIRVFRVKPDTSADDLLQYEQEYRATSHLFSGLLLDTFSDQYGGTGKAFNWSLILEELAPRVVLSGGLSVQNVHGAVTRLRPYAVDVSSGVELAKGIKDAAKIRAFINAVRTADVSS